MNKTLFTTLLLSFSNLLAQEKKEPKIIKDSLYIQEVETPLEKEKVLHAEPLFIDLIRDLGARIRRKRMEYRYGINRQW